MDWKVNHKFSQCKTQRSKKKKLLIWKRVGEIWGLEWEGWMHNVGEIKFKTNLLTKQQTSPQKKKNDIYFCWIPIKQKWDVHNNKLAGIARQKEIYFLSQNRTDPYGMQCNGLFL